MNQIRSALLYLCIAIFASWDTPVRAEEDNDCNLVQTKLNQLRQGQALGKMLYAQDRVEAKYLSTGSAPGLNGRYGPLSRKDLLDIELFLLRASAAGYLFEGAQSAADSSEVTLSFRYVPGLKPIRPVDPEMLKALSLNYTTIAESFNKFRELMTYRLTQADILADYAGGERNLDLSAFLVLRGESFVRRAKAQGHMWLGAFEDAYAAGEIALICPCEVQMEGGRKTLVYERIYINNKSGNYKLDGKELSLVVDLLRIHGINAKNWSLKRWAGDSVGADGQRIDIFEDVNYMNWWP